MHPKNYRTTAAPGRCRCCFLSRRPRLCGGRPAGRVAAGPSPPERHSHRGRSRPGRKTGSRRVAAGQAGRPSPPRPGSTNWLGSRPALQLPLRRPGFHRRRRRLAVPPRRCPPPGGRRNAGLDLAARQDGTESDLAHQALPRLPRGRYPADLRKHRRQGHAADRGRAKPRPEAQSIPAGEELHGSRGPRRPLRRRRFHALYADGCPVATGPSLTLLRQDFEKLEINRSVIKTPLAIGKRNFEHGLGTHSISRIRLSSPKPIAHFSAWVGVDCNDQTRGGAGSVVFSVSTEDGPLFNSERAARRPGGGESRPRHQGRQDPLPGRGRRRRRAPAAITPIGPTAS